MNELYRETSDTADGATSEPGSGGEHGYSPETTRNEQTDYRDYTETTAQTEARIAAEDELPTPDESRQATWGDQPEYYDETNLGEDGDYDAALPDDDLPSPDETWERTWGENPDYYNGTDSVSDDSGDTGSVDGDDARARDMQSSPDNDGILDEDSARAGETPDDQGQRVETDNHEQSAELPAGDNGASSSPETERLTTLEAEHAETKHELDDARQQIADLTAKNDKAAQQIEDLKSENAQLGKNFTDLQARLERLEQASQAEPSAGITGQERDTAQQDTARAPKEGRWLSPSNEGLALGAAASGGVITTVSDYFPYLHADVAGITASAVAVGAAAVTYMRARREAKHARRSKD